MFIEDSNGMQLLAAIKAQLAAKNKNSTTRAFGDSFRDVLQTVQKERDEFDAVLDKVDLAQYQLSLADSFWSGKNNSAKYLRNYTLRHQQNLLANNLTNIVQSIGTLNNLSTALAFGTTTSAASLKTLNKQLTSTLLATMMFGMRNNYSTLL